MTRGRSSANSSDGYRPDNMSRTPSNTVRPSSANGASPNIRTAATLSPGARFSSGTPTYGPGSGTITIVEVGDKVTLADLVNDEGPLKGGTALAIFRRDGETLHACWSYTTTRPTEFKNEGNNFRFTFKRVKK